MLLLSFFFLLLQFIFFILPALVPIISFFLHQVFPCILPSVFKLLFLFFLLTLSPAFPFTHDVFFTFLIFPFASSIQFRGVHFSFFLKAITLFFPFALRGHLANPLCWPLILLFLFHNLFFLFIYFPFLLQSFRVLLSADLPIPIFSWLHLPSSSALKVLLSFILQVFILISFLLIIFSVVIPLSFSIIKFILVAPSTFSIVHYAYLPVPF